MDVGKQRPWRVMVADDMAPMRNLLRMILRKQGISEFVLAEDGQEAVNLFMKESLKKRRPDIVLLDIDMPRMNGLEALQEIRSVDSEVFIAMVSANSAEDSVVDAKEARVDGFLVKPIRSIQVEELLARFEKRQSTNAS
ncbi:MAG: response regulator [Gammaproteobacteria bacterium]|nr:response regulator [Gammaproteobacteria bacterium]MBT4606791.1 response regulator [Thiotrichales bacterium]MBT3471527.1 response regulator [Gammaproteobacteria bacterium]MBT3967158.1 response regulator [Gammaproteobacteria bacterium]MBT4081131.1 response regulator [Gammaproteobacteria bacterium]